MVGLQIRRALQFFYSTSQLSEVDQIILSGGSAVIKGLADKVSEGIGVETIVVDPIAEMIIGKGVDEVPVDEI